MNLHNSRLLTDAIIHALESDGLVVGDGVAPTNSVPTGGYVVVYPLTGGDLDGPLGAPNDDASVLYQFTCVGHDRRQCQWIADKARATILATPLPLAGRQIMLVEVDMLAGITRDDDAQPPVFYAPERYRIWTTPT